MKKGFRQKALRTTTRVAQASRDGGTFRGSLVGWHGPQTASRHQEHAERVTLQRRTEDLWANDWAARSGIDAIVTNAVGTGLVPQAQPAARRLGIDKHDARSLAQDMEDIWADWTCEAHISDMLHFADLQFLGMRTFLKLGEMLHLPVMLSEQERVARGRTFSLCLQNIAPQRLTTPEDLQFYDNVHDGVHISANGTPLGYHIAIPSLASGVDMLTSTSVSAPFSGDCAYIPVRRGHRPGIFHVFRPDTDEQVRGVSPLATGIRLFRHLTDALDHELYAQVIAAAFPVFFATEHPPAPVGYPGLDVGLDTHAQSSDTDFVPYQAIDAGTMLYGKPGQKMEVIESKRPSANFASFVEIIMRGMSASLGIPYESLSKDFSKTNYSSARAALNEAWKMYTIYRTFYARLYCQPLYSMVMEEAFLRGELTLPGGKKTRKGFYEARRLWCHASWVGPARGFVDPVKEISATIMALENNLMTYSEAWKERGGDFDTGLEIMTDEAERMAHLPKKDSVKDSTKSTASDNQDADQGTQDDDDNTNDTKDEDDATQS